MHCQVVCLPWDDLLVSSSLLQCIARGIKLLLSGTYDVANIQDQDHRDDDQTWNSFQVAKGTDRQRRRRRQPPIPNQQRRRHSIIWYPSNTSLTCVHVSHLRQTSQNRETAKKESDQEQEEGGRLDFGLTGLQSHIHLLYISRPFGLKNSSFHGSRWSSFSLRRIDASLLNIDDHEDDDHRRDIWRERTIMQAHQILNPLQIGLVSFRKVTHGWWWSSRNEAVPWKYDYIQNIPA